MKLIYCAKRWLTQPPVVRDLRSSSCPRSLPVMFPSASALSQRCSANVAHWLPQKIKKKQEKKAHILLTWERTSFGDQNTFSLLLEELAANFKCHELLYLIWFYFFFFLFYSQNQNQGGWKATSLPSPTQMETPQLGHSTHSTAELPLEGKRVRV